MSKKTTRTDNLISFLRDRYNAVVYPMGEPGYTEGHIIICDWNDKYLHERHLDSTVERMGYLPGFWDEWDEIGGKAYRIIGDSYDWRPAWVWYGCERVLKSELREDFDAAEDYIDSVLLNAPKAADTIGLDVYLLQLGFTHTETEYENGLREGCNDDPNKILDFYTAAGFDVVFQIRANSDPYVTTFRVWTRHSDWEDPIMNRPKRNVCFVHQRSTPDNLIAVLLNEWFNSFMLTAYDYPSGVTHPFHPGVFDDITNGVPVYGSSKEDQWMAVNPTYIGFYIRAVKQLYDEGYYVSVKTCPTKSVAKPGR